VVQSPAASTVLNGHNDVEIVTLTATDASSNSQSCTFSVTLKDVTKPNLTCPPNVTLNASASCNAPNGAYSPTALSDNCTANPTLLQSPASNVLISGHNAVSTVTLTATDGAGNTQSCTLTVTLKDVSPPSITCRNAVALLNASGNASIVPGDVYQSGVDNCGVVNLVSVTPNTFTCNNIGFNTVTLTANDGNGNTATCVAQVIVRDITAPTVSCKNATLNLGVTGVAIVPPSLINNGASDNCSFSLTVTPGTLGCANIGANTVVLRATDAGGNFATCTAIVTVRDLSAPNAKCKNPTIFLDDAGDGTLSIGEVDNNSTDACGIAFRSISQTAFNCSHISGTNPVILTLTDVNGNTATCISYVTVKDALPPTPICEDAEVKLGANGFAVIYTDDLTFNSFDNCSVWTQAPLAKVYTAANLGTNNLIITVKDWSGNGANCVSLVTVLPFSGNSDYQQGGGESKGPQALLEVRLYPNPTRGDAMLVFAAPLEESVQIRIFDLSGRQVYHQKAWGLAGENVWPIRMEGVAPGLYQLDIQSDTWYAQQRLIIQE